jgi:uncharacterized membrane protein YhaH (DUF805 family)
MVPSVSIFWKNAHDLNDKIDRKHYWTLNLMQNYKERIILHLAQNEELVTEIWQRKV